MKKMTPARWVPRVEYHRYDGPARRAFTRWFTFNMYWGRRLWLFTVKHHQVTLDFRGNLLEDMAP
jgi:hypothetical protein